MSSLNFREHFDRVNVLFQVMQAAEFTLLTAKLAVSNAEKEPTTTDVMGITFLLRSDRLSRARQELAAAQESYEKARRDFNTAFLALSNLPR